MTSLSVVFNGLTELSSAANDVLAPDPSIEIRIIRNPATLPPDLYFVIYMALKPFAVALGNLQFALSTAFPAPVTIYSRGLISINPTVWSGWRQVV